MRVCPIMGEPDAGIFFGYHVRQVDGKPFHRFDMLGIRQGASGTGYALYLASATYFFHDDGSSTLIPVDRESWEVTIDDIRQFFDLKLDFKEGQLESVWCDEKRFRITRDHVPESPRTAKAIGVYGVFTQNGAASIRRPRFSE